jgi:ubiquinone/menaquinone biosynthesis C-methylase UbiE
MKNIQPKWPKKIPELSLEQIAIRDEFMRLHLEAMQTKWYGIIEKFNQTYPLKSFQRGCKTLEIGAGIGSHLKWENIQDQEYYALEIRQELCDIIKSKYDTVNIISADCQEKIPFEDNFLTRILAIHILEHLPNLSAALQEISRVISPDGKLSVVIPCEGGLAYTIARNISARPHFERQYKQKYDWLINSEHINKPAEIIEELQKYFNIIHKSYYPLLIPLSCFNLAIGLTLIKK